MFRFLVGGFHPVVIEPDGQRGAGKPRDDVPMQVHGVEFDMCDRMQKGDPASLGPGLAVWHIARVEEFGLFGP